LKTITINAGIDEPLLSVVIPTKWANLAIEVIFT